MTFIQFEVPVLHTSAQFYKHAILPVIKLVYEGHQQPCFSFAYGPDGRFDGLADSS